MFRALSSDRFGLRRVDDLLIAWLQARGIRG